MSPQVNIPWDEVHGLEPVPTGTYRCRISGVEDKVSDKKNPYWNIEFTIQDDPYVGRKLFTVCMLDVKTAWKLRQLAESIGLDLAGRQDLDSEELLEQELLVVVSQEMYEDQLRNRVKSFKAV